MAGIPEVIIPEFWVFPDGPKHPASAKAVAMRNSITAREETFIAMDLPAVHYEGYHCGGRGADPCVAFTLGYFPTIEKTPVLLFSLPSRIPAFPPLNPAPIWHRIANPGGSFPELV